MLDPRAIDDMADKASVKVPLRRMLSALHYAYPAIVFLYYMSASSFAICTLQTKISKQQHPRRRVITWLLALVILTYFSELLALGTRGLALREFPIADQDTVISLLSCALAYGVVFAGLVDFKHPVWYPYTGAFGVALIFEPVVQVVSWITRSPKSLDWAEIFEILAVTVRYLTVASALVLHYMGNHTAKPEQGTDSERQSLLRANGNANEADVNAQAERSQNNYGATSNSNNDSDSDSDSDGDENPWASRQKKASKRMEKRLKENGNWVTYAKSYLVVRNPPVVSVGCVMSDGMH